MNGTIVILGGYGVFGQRIARTLSQARDVSLMIAGRNLTAARAFADAIDASAVRIDLGQDSLDLLDYCRPSLVINCCGPFQEQDYRIARECIRKRIHYIDLADSRAYVNGFAELDNEAKSAGVILITGASTVPAISAAVLDHYLATDFSEIHAIDYGVTPGNRTDRGIATVAAILSYVGKPFTTLIRKKSRQVYGWQELHREYYPDIGMRWMSACDIPDLDLFPQRYPTLETIRFYAGLELSVLHVGLWALSWLVRWGVVRNYTRYASLFRAISLWFYALGTDKGGMHMKMRGLDFSKRPINKSWYLIAGGGDGPQIPATPAVIVARKIMRGEITQPGANSAMGHVTCNELMNALQGFNVQEVIA